MAISLLQDAQNHALAAALAGIKHEDADFSLSLSPPMSANNSATSLYPSLQQAAAASAALGMLTPAQIFTANKTAAALMAAQLPMNMASSLFPHHHAYFGSWAAAAAAAANNVEPVPHLAAPQSPPVSPQTPIGSANITTGNKHTLSSPTTAGNVGEQPTKKPRKLNVKKDLIDIPLNVIDLYHTPTGPISPPSSGSSPSSTHDAPIAATAAVTSIAHKDPSRDKSFTCKICSRSFGYKHVLQNHERTHTGEKPFECPECHKRFTRDHHLKTHMRLHTGEKPYHCSHCDRQFVQVANLRRHLRVHTGERPYTCEICGGKFSDSNQLKSHMLVHNGEKPFECDRCHMKFRRRHHLMNHKCGIQSPPTPAISPAISADYGLCDQKSLLGSSFGSEESMDLGKPAIMSTLSYETEHLRSAESPLDLSDENAEVRSAGRKTHDMHRIFRLPTQIMQHIAHDMPEQTEPEDLSMHSPRSRHIITATRSPASIIMMPDDIDLDELDDAATLFMRQQQKQQQQQLQLKNWTTV